MGLFQFSDGAQSDFDTGALDNVTYDPHTGALAFESYAGMFQFSGTLKRETLSGPCHVPPHWCTSNAAGRHHSAPTRESDHVPAQLLHFRGVATNGRRRSEAARAEDCQGIAALGTQRRRGPAFVVAFRSECLQACPLTVAVGIALPDVLGQAEIADSRHSIQQPGWRWAVGVSGRHSTTRIRRVRPRGDSPRSFGALDI